MAAGGDISCGVGAAGSEVADTNVSGDGTIDVSGGTEDTLGEVAEIFRKATGWECYVAGALNADSSNNTLATRAASATDVQSPGGAALFLDSSVALSHGVLISARDLSKGFDYGERIANKGSIVGVVKVATDSTYTGAGTIDLYRCVPDSTGLSRTTETLMWTQSYPATGVEKSLDFSNIPLEVNAGEDIYVTMDGVTTLVTANISVQGRRR